MFPRKFTNFTLLIHSASQKGLLLFFAALLAIIISNSSYKASYLELLNIDIGLSFGSQSLQATLQDWVNNLLMSLFFFTVGMEIKRELLIGHLSKRNQRILPLFSAIGGVIAPALIFSCFNYSQPMNMKGIAIPTATDIAFALGALALVAKNLPLSLRVFLTALAIIDDLIAVVIIALVYTTSLNIPYLCYAIACIATLFTLNRLRVASGLAYAMVGGITWFCIQASGIHATITGVIVGLFIPLNASEGRKPIEEFEKSLYSLVYYIIMPLFAFANSGIDFTGFTISVIQDRIVIGVALGLLVGKQLGIFSTALVLIKAKICKLPEHATILQLYGVSVICGIGFTMSLFIGILAFADSPSESNDYGMLVKIGVLGGSIMSFALAAIILQAIQKNSSKIIAP